MEDLPQQIEYSIKPVYAVKSWICFYSFCSFVLIKTSWKYILSLPFIWDSIRLDEHLK